MNPVLALILLLYVVPVGVSAATLQRDGEPWHRARRDPTGLAPDPAKTPEAVLQVYAAPAFGWRGIFSVHTWISVKRSGAAGYARYEVVGWGVDQGTPAVRVNRLGPDSYWYGGYPTILLDRRGDGVDALIEQVEQAIARYPYPDRYRTWPGPNSNTFTAFVAREVPELRLELPPNALGKDFLPGGALFASAPSGTGYQLSLFGLAGVMLAADEGIELSVLGLTFGIGVNGPAIKLPGIGRIGF